MSNERDAAWNKAVSMQRNLEALRTGVNRLTENAIDKRVTDTERARNMGSYWGDARTEGGFKVWEIAEKLGMEDAVLRGHELGIEPEVWEGKLPIDYAGALERPELYPEFCNKFNISPFGQDQHQENS